jgi:hypothetical protein
MGSTTIRKTRPSPNTSRASAQPPRRETPRVPRTVCVRPPEQVWSGWPGTSLLRPISDPGATMDCMSRSRIDSPRKPAACARIPPGHRRRWWWRARITTPSWNPRNSVAAVRRTRQGERLTQLARLKAWHARVHPRKGSGTETAALNPDRTIGAPWGALTLPGRSLRLAAPRGHHMTTDAVTLETAPRRRRRILDAMCTVAIALHDLRVRRVHPAARAALPS